MKHILGLLFLCACLTMNGLAQEPNHYFFGEERFIGVDIYDVIQDDEQRFWFATNQGLILHDGYSYKSVSCQEMKSLSLFNLRKSSDGTIYCYNLKNQVFRIVDDRVELFYTIKDSETPFNTHLEIYDDRVYVLTKDFTVFGNSGKKHSYNIDLDSSKTLIYLKTFNDGDALFLTEKNAFLFNGKTIEEFPFQAVEEANSNVVLNTWVDVNGVSYCIDKKTMNLLEFHKETKTFVKVRTLDAQLHESALRVYKVKNQIWLTGNRNGIYVYDLNWNPLYDGQPIFEEHFISDVLSDDEGNTLLSTFDEGVMVIPDEQLHSLRLPTNERITDFCIGTESLFIGTSEGKMYSHQNGIYKLLYTSPNNKPIECIRFWKSENLLIYTSVDGFTIAKWDGDRLKTMGEFKGALKDALFEENLAHVALNTGVKKIVPNGGNYSVESIESLRSRAYDLVRDKRTGTLYAGLSNGLTMYSSSIEKSELKFKQQRVFVTSLEYANDCIYAGTVQSGLLVYSNDRFKEQISVGVPILDIVPSDRQLFLQSTDGVYVFDMITKSVSPINQSIGIKSKVLSTMVVADETLLLASQDAINQIPINEIAGNMPAIPIKYIQLEVNGNSTDASTFDFTTNKYTFHFGVSTIRYRDNINYRYKLIGYDDDWEYLDYENNSISFKGLPPGDYRLEVQSVNGNETSRSKTFSFVIATPFYQQIWFYILIALLIIILVSGIYAIRLKQIRRKNKTLVEQQKIKADLLQMELKALRSQMNPHFIFNSLNSIQHLVLKEDTDNSYDYLVLFAKLVRNTLNYSDLNYIPINDEVEFLDVYLKLENLRFKKDFSYSIAYDGNEEVDVPPLILQPFIENALVHGLLHKEGEKMLSVTLHLGEHLTCEIVDNGIGREKARQINERRIEHKSFAMKAIQQRLELLNKHEGEDIGQFTVEDLYENKQAVGTKVTIILPVQRKY